MTDAVSVEVALRIRPLVPSEISRGCVKCLDVVPDEQQVIIKDLPFTYNYVFPPEVSQTEFYETAIKKMVNGLFKGYNVTILAYGQTGSGKTHSMGTAYSGESFKDMGVIPRAVKDIFALKNSLDEKFEFKIQVSFMELYQEQLFDLLSAKHRDQSILDIREDNKGIVIPGVTETEVTTADQTLDCLIRGSQRRAVGATAMNSQSSRSHSIFTIHIQQQKISDENSLTTSKFHLVDLAGSERANKTKATGARFKEGVKINQGLLALGNVISQLGEGSSGFIGYRDSKLTRLLQDSLGGNSLTLMIACVSPADYNLEETISTLRYADRARKIKNKPVVNQDPKAAEINRLKQVVQQLKLELLGKNRSLTNSAGDCAPDISGMEREIIELRTQNKQLTQALDEQVIETANVYEKMMLAEAAKERMSQKLLELKETYNQTIDDINNKSAEEGAIDVSKLQKVYDKIEEMQHEQKKSAEELIQHELEKERNLLISSRHVEEPQEDISFGATDTLSDVDADAKQGSHAMQQAALTNELHELNKALASKQALAAQVQMNYQNLPNLEENIFHDNQIIEKLQKEKDDLLKLIKSMQSSNSSTKIAEDRRKKVQLLETQIAELQKKITQQAKLIKLREKDDQRIKTLNSEIIAMKANKVKLIRTMRSESENFRAWKISRERELSKLKDQDRKRQNAMQRMEFKHNKQQNVLKRKVEEAVAINKRLKDAMDRQKSAQLKRQIGQGKVEQLRSWVDQELEVLLSTIDAERTLEQLLEDRGMLAKRLEHLKENKNNTQNKQEIKQLTEDLELRSAQISDFQQKILASDQENKSKTRWDAIQSMIDAKCALKHLFEAAADMRRDTLLHKYKHQDVQIAYHDALEKVTEYEKRIKELSNVHSNELANIEKEHQEKVSILLRELRGKTSKEDVGEEINKRLRIQEEALDKMEVITAELEQYRTECENLKKQLASVAEVAQSSKARSKTTQKQSRKINSTYVETEQDQELLYSTDSDDPNDNPEIDPDYRNTPVFKRIQKSRIDMLPYTSIASKRSSDGATKCSCKGTCSNRICGCKKIDLRCSAACNCSTDMCINRSDKENMDDNNKDSASSVSGASDDSGAGEPFKKPRINPERVLQKKDIINRRKKGNFF